MLRALLVMLMVAGALAVFSHTAIAADTELWPEYLTDPGNSGDEHTLVRGPGQYLSTAKIVFSWLLFAIWVRTIDWVCRDATQVHQPVTRWTTIIFGCFFAAFVLLWLIPYFAVGFILLILAYAGPLGAYIYLRNQAVDAHLRVLTPDHIRFLVSRKAKSVGVTIAKEKKAGYERGAAVDFTAKGGGSETVDNANLVTARQSPGYVVAKDLFAETVKNRGDVIMLDYSREEVTVRYQIDGVWHAAEPRDRASGDSALVALKTLAGLSANQRVRKQTGIIGAAFEGKKYVCRLLCQGTQTGERVLLRIEGGAAPLKTLEELGIREKRLAQINDLLAQESGFVIFATLPGDGLSTLMNVALVDTDRLLRNFIAIEEIGRREPDIENVEVMTYDSSTGQTPGTMVARAIAKYPDVVVVRELIDGEAIEALSEQVENKRLTLAGIRAKDAAEVPLRVLALKTSAKTFVAALSAVIYQRLVRKLCTACRVAYEPTPELLQKLGLPPGRVKVMYREPKPEERQEVCRECGGFGFLGRTAIVELLQVNEAIRATILKDPKHEAIRKAARQAGNLSLQDEGILLVAMGTTSLSELNRVLKG